MDNEVLPWLRKQKGFLDPITLAVPGGREIVSISFWDHEENAQVYNSMSYPEALEILRKILAGTPQVKTFDVVSSTLQKVDPPKPFSSTARGRGHDGDTTSRGEPIASGVSVWVEHAAAPEAMMIPAKPANEQQRLATLRGYEILDTEPEAAFDDLTFLASHICQRPLH